MGCVLVKWNLPRYNHFTIRYLLEEFTKIFFWCRKCVFWAEESDLFAYFILILSTAVKYLVNCCTTMEIINISDMRCAHFHISILLYSSLLSLMFLFALILLVFMYLFIIFHFYLLSLACLSDVVVCMFLDSFLGISIPWNELALFRRMIMLSFIQWILTAISSQDMFL